MSCLSLAAYHLLRHLLRHVLVQLKEELDGVVVLVLPVELLGVVHAQPQLQARLHRVVLLRQFHVHAVVLLKERVIQKILDGVPTAKEGKVIRVCTFLHNFERQVLLLIDIFAFCRAKPFVCFNFLPFVFVHTYTAFNDLLEFWDFDFVETVRFNALRKYQRRILVISSIVLHILMSSKQNKKKKQKKEKHLSQSHCDPQSPV